MKHCGNEVCRGPLCENWEKCRGETIPPWTTGKFAPSTAAVSIREQDVLATADELFDAIKNWREYQTHNACDEHGWARVADAMRAYRDAREGRKS